MIGTRRAPVARVRFALGLLITCTIASRALAEEKDPAVARIAAVGTTTLAASAIYFGFFHDDKANLSLAEGWLGWTGFTLLPFAPSVGHAYAGEKKRAVTMYGLRTGALVLFVGGWFVWRSEGDCHSGCGFTDVWDGKLAMGIGGTFFVGSALWDFYDAGRAADRANRRYTTPMITPYVGPSLAGLSLAGEF